MGPARERLETHNGIRGQVEFGLVMNLDFAVFDGAPQLALQHQTLPRRAAQAVTERHDAVFPVPFRRDHRAVGLSQHLPALFSVVRKEADPDAGGHPDRMALDLERLLQDFQRALGRAFGIPSVLHIVQDQRELVAADACQRVRLPEARFHPLRHLAEEYVAHAVTQAVIDQLESIQIDIEQRYLPVLAPRLGHAVRQPIRQQPAIGQAGQIVHQRHMLQPGFGVSLRAVPPLQLREHRVEPVHQLADLLCPSRRHLRIERPLGRYLQHRSGQIADGLCRFRCLPQSLRLFAQPPPQLVHARENHQDRHNQKRQDDRHHRNCGRRPRGSAPDNRQIRRRALLVRWVGAINRSGRCAREYFGRWSEALGSRGVNPDLLQSDAARSV